MNRLSDEAVDRLRSAMKQPDLSDTRYKIIREAGRGGMSEVYLAEDTKLNRRVAIKVLSLPTASEQMRSRMLKEARIIARLEHPGIVPVHDAGLLLEGRVFYVMKFVQGSRLDQYVKDSHTLPDRLRIFQKICEAVTFAHAHGVIHRDLKPQNIMVGPFGEVLVMDWGVAKVLREDAEDDSTNSALSDHSSPEKKSAEETAHGTIIGTPAYMPPEQARGQTEKIDERADVYALGAILHFLLTDQPPLASDSTGNHPARPRQLNAKIPRAIEGVCMKALSQDRSNRYDGAHALGDEVTRFLNGQPVAAYREGLFERAGRFISRNRFIVLLILAYLVMRIFVLLMWGR